MLIDFFLTLRRHRLPVSLKEHLMLIEAVRDGIIGPDIDAFYLLARAALIKDESLYDRYDLAFAEYFKGVQALTGLDADIPLEWLRRQAELELTADERARIEAMGGWEKLMEALRKRLEEQHERHQGGNRMIGTAGTSPFGAFGFNPEGVRIGQDASRHRRAVKVWDQREFRNLDGTAELGTRNIKVALRRLRRFAREGAADELDLEHTISGTARNAGLLDIQMRPERRNAIKVLLFLDIGGSMDDHIKLCEELFSAARSEFKRLEHFYFHNCLYEHVWKDNRRRLSERTRTVDILNKYGHDHKVIFIGDATMSPYEIMQPGGSLEYANEEPGAVWLKRVLDTWPRTVWLNPEPEERWNYRQSVAMIRDIFKGRMFPTTLQGLEQAMKVLSR
jgi:hypothetical protein